MISVKNIMKQVSVMVYSVFKRVQKMYDKISTDLKF